MTLRVMLVAVVLVWIAFAILGVLFHVIKGLLYIALLATLALLVAGTFGRRSR